MISFDNLRSLPLIENQRVTRAAPAAQSVRMGVPHALAAAGRGHPRNRVSLSERVKAVRFYRSKRPFCQLAGNWKLNAGLPGRGEGAAR